MIATLVLIASTAVAADLRVGEQAPAFAVITGEDEINLPGSYRGKIVLIDFFATWCGPCMREVPNIKRAYEAHHSNGFEILAISYDKKPADLLDYIKRNGIPWTNVGADSLIGERYGVKVIPAMFLIDGDSGKILATTNQLRGQGLSNFIGKELAKKNRRG